MAANYGLDWPGIATLLAAVSGHLHGFVVQMVTGKVADLFAEDDAEEMIDIISIEFESMAEEYLLNEEEANVVIDNLNKSLDATKLKDMYASSNRKGFAREVLLRPLFSEIAEKRSVIEIPTEDQYQKEVINVLEEIYDEEEVMKEAA